MVMIWLIKLKRSESTELICMNSLEIHKNYKFYLICSRYNGVANCLVKSVFHVNNSTRLLQVSKCTDQRNLVGFRISIKLERAIVTYSCSQSSFKFNSTIIKELKINLLAWLSIRWWSMILMREVMIKKGPP